MLTSYSVTPDQLLQHQRPWGGRHHQYLMMKLQEVPLSAYWPLRNYESYKLNYRRPVFKLFNSNFKARKGVWNKVPTCLNTCNQAAGQSKNQNKFCNRQISAYIHNFRWRYIGWCGLVATLGCDKTCWMASSLARAFMASRAWGVISLKLGTDGGAGGVLDGTWSSMDAKHLKIH